MYLAIAAIIAVEFALIYRSRRIAPSQGKAPPAPWRYAWPMGLTTLVILGVVVLQHAR